MLDALEVIEVSGIYTNFGPVNTRFEELLTKEMFGGVGHCLTVANATIGLMVAIREAAVTGTKRRYALMPSFTFAATPHAAQWAGLTPLLCDIDPDTWLPDPESEDSLLKRYDGQVACIVPYATFGNCLELDRYQELADRHGAGLVVDAAASLGSLDNGGRGFGTAASHSVVFSMHATKTFAALEGGAIYTSDPERAARLRAMTNFGFDADRVTTMPGLNGKMSEVGALVAQSRLDGFDEVLARRAELVDLYRILLPDLVFQRHTGARIAHQFVPALLPIGWAARRGQVVKALEVSGVGVRHYFSPHIAQQPYFATTCLAGDLPITDEVAGRIVSLPLADDMTPDEVRFVCDVAHDALRGLGQDV